MRVIDHVSKKAHFPCGGSGPRVERKFMNKDITNSKNCKGSDKKSIVEAVNQVLKMVSGQGQFHTANPEAKKPRPYGAITFDEIISMVKNPVDVPKSEAPWALFSSVHGPYARSAEYQRQNGLFHALWLDLDDVGPIPPEGVADCLSMVVGTDTYIIAYNTKSATHENQKCRVIIPLAEPCPGKDFEVYQKILNDRIQKEFPPDRKTETANQICYLPNRGTHYECHIKEGVPLI